MDMAAGKEAIPVVEGIFLRQKGRRRAYRLDDPAGGIRATVERLGFCFSDLCDAMDGADGDGMLTLLNPILDRYIRLGRFLRSIDRLSILREATGSMDRFSMIIDGAILRSESIWRVEG